VITIRFAYAAHRTLPLLLLALLQTACSSVPSNRGGYYLDDGPHSRPQVDVSAIPDASPRNDPRSASGNKPYTVFGKMYYPLKDANGYHERGISSWYGKKFHGKRTSSGEAYDMYSMTAAHKTLPLPSYVRVRNLNNGRSVTVRVNDRGPFLDNRLIDLSYAAASRLGIVGSGTGIVEVVGVSADEPAASSMPAQAPAAAAAAADNAAQPRLYLQVGAFASRDNAESLRLQLERAEFKPVQVQVAAQDQSTLYRVRIGPLANVDASDNLAQRIAGYGIANAFVTVE
jgi:rare lipoprotein A